MAYIIDHYKYVGQSLGDDYDADEGHDNNVPYDDSKIMEVEFDNDNQHNMMNKGTYI